MKRGLKFLIILFAVVTVLFAAETGQSLFQKALIKERAEVDMTGAIRLYERVVKEFGKDRKLAAEALFRIGECHQALGNAEARRTFERLVREYAEQTQQAENARARLSALERAGGIGHPPGITLRKVWASNHWLAGSPSPDGQSHTLTDWDTGDLALRDLSTGQSRRLTNKGSWKESNEYAEGSVISGDGKQIAFAWWNKEKFYELRVSGLDGSKPRAVYRDKEYGTYIEPYQWTADGKQILAALRKQDTETRIALIPAAGGLVRVLKSLEYTPRRVSLSPDGHFLVYDVPERVNRSKRDILLLSLEGAREVPLVQQQSDDRGPIWTPDGKKALFVSDRTGTSGFWAIDVIDGKPQGIPQLLKDGLGRAVRPNGFTRQGAFYYSSQTSMADVYVAELDPVEGKMLRQSTPVAPRFVGTNSSPSWSPDGRRLAYYSWRGVIGDSPTLVILSIESGEAKDIAVRLDQVLYPVRWFPDGKSVLVGAWDSPKRDQIAFYRVDVQTGDHRLVRSSPGTGPIRSELSPDGKTLFFGTGGDPKVRGGLISHDIETGEGREIARVPYLAGRGWTRLAVSPDGRFVAFRSPVDEDQWTALRIVPAIGGQLHELLRFRQSETIGNDEIAFTPDGRYVLFLRCTGKDDVPELWRIPAAGGEPQRTGFSAKEMGLFSLHPDGRRIAFEVGKFSGMPNEVWVLENFIAATESKAVTGAK